MTNRKNIWLGILVMTLIFGLTVISCDNDDGSSFEERLYLSGRVWTLSWDDEDEPIWKEFTGNRTVNEGGFVLESGEYIRIGGSGFITGGQLNFSIDKPYNLVEIKSFFIHEWNELFDDFTISSSNVRAAEIQSINVSGAGNTGRLIKLWSDYYILETVWYIYVDGDVAITGSGNTEMLECNCVECDCEEWEGRCDCGATFTIKSLDLNFKAGWNAVTYKLEWSEENQTMTITISTGDSSRARWVLGEDYYWNGYNMSIGKENARYLLKSVR